MIHSDSRKVARHVLDSESTSMAKKRMQPVTERSAWTAQELAADSAWCHMLLPSEVKELHVATEAAQSAGLQVTLNRVACTRGTEPSPP